LGIIYELALGRPNILQSSSTQLHECLRIEDPKRRYYYVELFGRILIDSVTVSEQFALLAHEFVNRYSDISPEIRLKMAELSRALLLKLDSTTSVKLRQLAPDVTDALKSRSHDKDEKVRRAVITCTYTLVSFDLPLWTQSYALFGMLYCMYVCVAVCEATLERPDSVPLTLLDFIAERMNDRKQAVRRDALEGLAHIFKKHVSEFWKSGLPLPDSVKKLTTIPRKLVMITKLATNHRMSFIVENLFDEVLLGIKTFTVEERARTLTGIGTLIS
jgi:sister-chromatid-cohesion protein PDS5